MSLAISNPHAWSRLAKHSVERTYRGQSPAPAITAPDPIPAADALLTETERLAYFDQSERTRDGLRANYRKPTA